MEVKLVTLKCNIGCHVISVPIHVVASFKKVKAVVSGNSQLAAVLQNSAKLVSFFFYVNLCFCSFFLSYT